MKTGIIASTFDLLHAGHVHFIRSCTNHCDYLVCALQTDVTDRQDKNRPVQSVYERYSQLEAVKGVRRIIPYESEKDLANLLVTVPHQIRFLGTDYVDRPFTGQDLYESNLYYEDLVDEHVIYPCVIFIHRKHDYSTSSLRKRVADAQR